MLLGIGVSAYVEITAGGGTSEYGAVTVNADGSATVMAGTSAHGQGHQTAFAMIVSAQTGIPVDRIDLVAVDTDLVRTGGGTGGSRSLQLGGSAVHRATEALVDKARRLAARLLEADPADIVVDTDAGTVGVAGVPARCARLGGARRRGGRTRRRRVDHADGTLGLAAQLDFDQGEATFPFGAHIAVVEVDQDTGQVTLLRHIAVDDCGTVLNPLLVEGQQHGGVAAGISQTLYEQIIYDDDGNPLTANFMDYGIPVRSRVPQLRGAQHRDAHAAEPAGREGHRRGQHDRQHAGRPERDHRRGRASGCAAHRPAVHQPTSVAGNPRRRGRHPARPVARATGDLRPAGRRPSSRRRGPQRSRGHLTAPDPMAFRKSQRLPAMTTDPTELTPAAELAATNTTRHPNESAEYRTALAKHC